MRTIDKEAMLHNIDEMINALEFDSMRSAGKCKLNAGVLVSLHQLREFYKPAAKPATKSTTKAK